MKIGRTAVVDIRSLPAAFSLLLRHAPSPRPPQHPCQPRLLGRVGIMARTRGAQGARERQTRDAERARALDLHNSSVAAILDEIADLLELEDANPFRVRA